MDKINQFNKLNMVNLQTSSQEGGKKGDFSLKTCVEKLVNRMDKEVPEYRLYKNTDSYQRPLLRETYINKNPERPDNEISLEIKPHSENPKFMKFEIALSQNDVPAIASSMLFCGTKKEVMEYLKKEENIQVFHEHIENLISQINLHKRK